MDTVIFMTVSIFINYNYLGIRKLSKTKILVEYVIP